MADLRATGLVSLVRENLGSVQVWRPRIRFRSRPLRQCPFLVNDVDRHGVYRGLCSLHPHDKPLVCALSPLARSVEIGPDQVIETWSFVPPVDGCPGVGIGNPLALGPPAPLKSRLNDEVLWMDRLIAETGTITEESEAWSWLGLS